MAEGMQAQQTGQTNQRLAEAMLADYTLRQIDERERAAGHRMAFGDLLRASKGKSMAERFQLAKALRDLDWQRKTAAMQQQLDEAGRKGQQLSMFGSLTGQAGGMATTAGLALGGGGGGALSGQSLEGAGMPAANTAQLSSSMSPTSEPLFSSYTGK
jgi:hypothetical protein